jgi:hypothetical protein
MYGLISAQWKIVHLLNYTKHFKDLIAHPRYFLVYYALHFVFLK